MFFAIASCKKSTTASTSGDNLFTEKIDNIQLNEPVLVSFGNANTAMVDWQITPNNNFTISKVAGYATLKFSVAGTYTAIGKVNNKQATYIITVVNKTFDDVGNGFGLTASKVVGVNANEEVLFTVNNATSSNITWTFTNLNMSVIAADKKSAIVSFKNGDIGTATVTDGTSTQSRTVFLNNPSSNSSIDTVPFIFGDKINIVPSLSTDKKTLYLSAATTYSYQCNSDKILSASDTTNRSYQVSYGGVVMASSLCPSIAPATCINSFINMPAGIFPFIISYENKTFEGTITVSAANVYTINFTDNYLININPKVVQ